MENFELQVAVHKDTSRLDPLVLRWAFSRKIITSPGELESYKKEKVNFFAGYLFPSVTFDQLEWIMKVFLWLFVLDDRLDKERLSFSRNFIRALKAGKTPAVASRYTPLFNSLIELWETFPGSDKQDWKTGWDSHWATFLNGIAWELENKYQEKYPLLSDYRYYRPHLSGVYLALHFLKLDHEVMASCVSDLLENKIARWICLSNDLLSAEKEERIGDSHNELFLLSRMVSRRDAKRHLEAELKTLLKHIQRLEAELLRESPNCQEWVSGLNLLMGGCRYWSNEVTVRYESCLNGTNQT